MIPFVVTNIKWLEPTFSDGCVRPSIAIVDASLITDLDANSIIDNINNATGGASDQIGGVGIEILEYIEKLAATKIVSFDGWGIEFDVWDINEE